MSEEKIEGFNTQPLMLEIDNVIRSGVKTILRDFMTRYELLEKTHNTIMNLPSVRNEMNKSLLDDGVSDNSLKTSISNIKDTTRVLVREEISTVEKKLDVIEKKFALFGPILDKILLKLHSLNEDVKILKQPSSVDIKTIENPVMIQPSIVSACENENIKFEIKEEPDCENCSEKVAFDKNGIRHTHDYCYNNETKSDESETDANLEEHESEEASDEDSVANSVEDDDVESVASLDPVASLDEEFFEIEIDDVTFCTNDDENGLIYELTKDGEVGDKVGYLKEGEPFFYADEK